jgi:hypothetical protein
MVERVDEMGEVARCSMLAYMRLVAVGKLRKNQKCAVEARDVVNIHQKTCASCVQDMVQRSWRIAQFQPREFSAMTGAEICCVRILRPCVLLLPWLPRLPGVIRPLRAPCIQAAAPPGIEP